MDFGRRLIRGWDEGAPKEEVREFVMEAVEEFFKRSDGILEKSASTGIKTKSSDLSKSSDVSKKKKEEEIYEAESPKKKGKAPAKKGTKSKGLETKAKEVAKKTSSSSSGKKPKCEATTAKGTPCSKCAVDGEVFCSVHLKSKTKKDEPKGKAVSAKGGKKAKVAESPKHSHGLTSPPLKECELCETHGMPFEIPEYEEETKEKEKDEIEDPDFKLTEDDFDESGSEMGSDEDEFDELD